MRFVAERQRSLLWSRPVIFAVLSVTVAGCSSDATRITENPFASRRNVAAASPQQSEVTGSVAPRAPSRQVSSQPLPPPNTSTMLPPPTRPAVSSTAGGSRGMASYNPGSSSSDVTGSVPRNPPPVIQARPLDARAPAPLASSRGWNWEGGTPVTVANGDTADSLGRRYGVPASAIIQANNLPNASAVRPGQRLVIPRYDASDATGSAMPRQSGLTPTGRAPAIGAPSTAPSGGQTVHTIAPGETLMKVSRQYGRSITEIARANNIAPQTQVKIGDRIVIPGNGRTALSLPQSAPAIAAPSMQQAQVAQQPQQLRNAPPRLAAVTTTQPAPTARTITPVTESPVAEEKSTTAIASSTPGFRWPVRGRVLAGFGPKTSGQQNDGINVAVPEGTPIKAAEDGVVAYAGSELKTYGNLVLIRHANGYVTAYAHASEISVKRDETIKRGQVIGKAGQTGNVSTPQVHFEVRKGSAPIDPMPFLDKGGGA